MKTVAVKSVSASKEIPTLAVCDMPLVNFLNLSDVKIPVESVNDILTPYPAKGRFYTKE